MPEGTETLSVERVTGAANPSARAVNHHARLVIDPRDHKLQSPFLLLAEDWFAPPAGFPTHPHRGIETLTFVLDGELQHRDHTGATGNLGPGDVQFMTAGSGIMHSEMPGQNGVHSLQLWLNLPASKKFARPGYQDVMRDHAAQIIFEGGNLTLYSGEAAGEKRPFASQWPITLIDAQLSPGGSARIEVPPRSRAFAYVLDGKLSAGLSGVNNGKGEVIWFELASASAGTIQLSSNSGSTARALVFAAVPIDEPVVFGGPFVMNTQEEIDQAFSDLHAGRLVRS